MAFSMLSVHMAFQFGRIYHVQRCFVPNCPNLVKGLREIQNGEHHATQRSNKICLSVTPSCAWIHSWYTHAVEVVDGKTAQKHLQMTMG